jgi:hypothetical protein
MRLLVRKRLKMKGQYGVFFEIMREKEMGF